VSVGSDDVMQGNAATQPPILSCPPGRAGEA
jgi:hypothetical protein